MEPCVSICTYRLPCKCRLYMGLLTNETTNLNKIGPSLAACDNSTFQITWRGGILYMSKIHNLVTPNSTNIATPHFAEAQVMAKANISQ